jgi:rhodanese-related sulfurtransferase
MALFMFWGGEQLEKIFGKRDLGREPRVRVAGAMALVLGAVAVLLIGAPDTADKWARVSDEKERLVAARDVQIHPGELLASLADDRLKVHMLDVRSESDYNLFHIQGAENVEPAALLPLTKDFLGAYTENTVYVVMSNDEAAATEAWRVMTAESVPNVYILEGGINNWLSIFAKEEPAITPTSTPVVADQLRYDFPAALGSRYEGASPNPHEWELEYTPKIKLQIKRDKSGGGCG